MTDETLPSDNDLVALQIGKAILNAQTMADRIVADARERADAISQPVSGAVRVEGRSRVSLIPKEEAVVMLRELDTAERELQDCQAQLVAFLDRCLAQLGDPGGGAVGVEREGSEPRFGNLEQTASGLADSPLDPEITETTPDPSLSSSGAQIELTTAEPEGWDWPLIPEAAKAEQPAPQADHSFWDRRVDVPPWDSAELETLGRPAFPAPPSPSPAVFGSDDLASPAASERPGMPSTSGDVAASSPVNARAVVDQNSAVPAVDRSGQYSEEMRPNDAWAPPSGPPVAVSSTAQPIGPRAVDDRSISIVSEATDEPDMGAFRRLISLPNMIALAGTLVVLLVLLIIVQTL